MRSSTQNGKKPTKNTSRIYDLCVVPTRGNKPIRMEPEHSVYINLLSFKNTIEEYIKDFKDVVENPITYYMWYMCTSYISHQRSGLSTFQ